jgi:histidine triad (HIT) family protein
MTRTTCVFCEIVAGRAPAHIVAEDELSLCLLDINPFTEGHCLVISKRHVPWWHELTEEETASVFGMARRVSLQLRRAFPADFVCLYARGRRIPHTHVFLVPSRGGDVLDAFFNALERFQESPQALAALRDGPRLAAAAARIRDAGGGEAPAQPVRVRGRRRGETRSPSSPRPRARRG